jgi:CRISPR/Cas system-associated endonuclease/helicase Cas3
MTSCQCLVRFRAPLGASNTTVSLAMMLSSMEAVKGKIPLYTI